MENVQVHHEDVINKVKEHLTPILEGSRQGIYVYLDEIHKFCNARFAELLGYLGPDEWASVESFMHFVDPESQEVLVSTYQKTMQLMTSSMINVTWLKKDGTRVPSTCIMVPFSCDGHVMALHFITVHDA